MFWSVPCALLLIATTEAVIPDYLPIHVANIDRNEAIESYFSLGFSASEILGFLLNVHGIQLSMRQLRRILKSLGCKRKGQSTDFGIIVHTIEQELRGSGSIIGYGGFDYHKFRVYLCLHTVIFLCR